jgi:putative ABC transport system permease protein
MRFLTFIIKNLVRRRLRSLLTIAGIGLAVGAMIALVGISRGFVDSFIELYQGRGIDLVVVRAGVAERLTSALDESVGVKIRELPGVKQVAGVMMDVVSFPELNMFGVPILGWEPGAFMFENLKLVSGRAPTNTDGKVVLLGSILSKNMGKTTGDTIDVLEGETFQVIGVYESFSVVENGSMIVTLAELQRLMDRGGRVNVFNIIAENRFDESAVEKLRGEVLAVAPGLSAMTTEDFVTSDTQIRAARGMAWMTSIVALLIGSVGVLNTMAMSVFERTQEIGILRAIGWRKSRVVRMILFEAVLMSLGGALVGTAGAVLLTRIISRLPAFSSSISSHIPLQVVGQGVVIALILGLLGGLYPAIYGARLYPTEAIRHD